MTRRGWKFWSAQSAAPEAIETSGPDPFAWSRELLSELGAAGDDALMVSTLRTSKTAGGVEASAWVQGARASHLARVEFRLSAQENRRPTWSGKVFTSRELGWWGQGSDGTPWASLDRGDYWDEEPINSGLERWAKILLRESQSAKPEYYEELALDRARAQVSALEATRVALAQERAAAMAEYDEREAELAERVRAQECRVAVLSLPPGRERELAEALREGWTQSSELLLGSVRGALQ